MDPNANLAEQRRLSREIQEMNARDDSHLLPGFGDRAVRLAELVQALDEWLMKGGFTPNAWFKAP